MVFEVEDWIYVLKNVNRGIFRECRIKKRDEKCEGKVILYFKFRILEDLEEESGEEVINSIKWNYSKKFFRIRKSCVFRLKVYDFCKYLVGFGESCRSIKFRISRIKIDFKSF